MEKVFFFFFLEILSLFRTVVSYQQCERYDCSCSIFSTDTPTKLNNSFVSYFGDIQDDGFVLKKVFCIFPFVEKFF